MDYKLVVIAKTKDGRTLRGSYPYLEAFARKMVFENDPGCARIDLYEEGFEPGGDQAQTASGGHPLKGQVEAGGVGSGQAGTSPDPEATPNQAPTPSVFGLRHWSGL